MTYSNTYSSPSSPTNFNPFSGMGMRKGGRPSLFPGSGDGSTLSLDFTTMGGVLDPRLTFSRASTATFVNSSGYVEYAAHNLYYNTNFATISTVGSNPSLTGTGWGYALNSGTSFSATFNTNGSVTMSAAAGRIGLLRSVGLAGTGRRLIFSVDITSTGDTGIPPTQMIQEVTKTNETYYINGTLWTSGNVVGPCTVSFVFTSNPAGNASTYFGIGLASTSTGSATFANPRWGFYGGVNQLAYSPNTAATNANYLTAEYHAPRFDYSPTTIGEPRGLLIEGSSINTLLNSQRIDSAAGGWFFGGSGTRVTTPNYSTGPDGVALSATRLQLAQNASLKQLGGTNGTNNTVSIWAKSNTGLNQNMAFWTGSAASNKVITSQWQRFEAVINFASLTALDFYKPDAGDCDISIWGAQLEAGSGASSYIPTGASQVTRNADDYTITGTNFSSWYNPNEGSTLIQWTGGSGQNNVDGRSHTFLNSTQTHQIFEGSGYALNVYSTTFQAQIGNGIGSLNSTAKIASAFKAANFATSVNGSNAVVQSSGTMPTLVDRLSIGSNYLNAGTFKFACIKQFKYYPVRLSDAQLKSLSTP